MAVRNGMPYLSQTLESVAAQTYRNHKLLVWDDCSDDGSLEELQRWIPDRIPGRIFAGRSLRLGPALGFLVEQADTELCARIDADDIALPHRLEAQVKYLLQHPEVGILGSRVQIINEDGTDIEVWDYPTSDAELRWVMRWTVQILHPALLFRKNVILRAGNYPDFKIEDSVLWIRCCPLTEIHNHPDRLLRYRRTQTSQTGAITDWMPLNRSVAQYCASIIFPGVPDPKRAMELWEATHQWQTHLPVKFRYLGQLKRAAVLLARQAGKPDDYFQKTQTYRLQRYHLRRRLVESVGLGFLIRLRARLA